MLDYLEEVAPLLAVRGYEDPLEDGDRLAMTTRVVKVEGVSIGMIHDIQWPGPKIATSPDGSDLVLPEGDSREFMARKFKEPVDVNHPAAVAPAAAVVGDGQDEPCLNQLLEVDTGEVEANQGTVELLHPQEGVCPIIEVAVHLDEAVLSCRDALVLVIARKKPWRTSKRP